MRAKLAILGGGRMGEALVGGLLGAGWADPHELAVVEVVAERRAALVARFPGVTITAEPVEASGAIVATKPGDVAGAVRAQVGAGVQRLLSIAAGVTIAAIERESGGDLPVVRAMPNTPALIGAGAAAIAPGRAASEADLVWAEEILGALGVVVRVPERLLDAVTGLSGSGPAYVFLVAEALIEAGVLVGLPRDTSTTLALQTLLGSARMLVESGETPEALRGAVTSPGGTTAAGLHALESAAVRAALLDAVRAATNRATELGG